MAKRPAPAADRNFGFLMHDVSRLLKRRFERQRPSDRAADHPAPGGGRCSTSPAIEGVSQAEVAIWLDIEPIALVRMLDKLHEEGLVERRAHPTDRRVRTLWLAPGAEPVVERILDINQAIREEAFAGLAPGTRDAMIAALGSIKENLALREESAAEIAMESSTA